MHEPSESADAESNESTAGHAVPDDFPHDPFPSGLSGTQPKFSARLIEGRYVVGLTSEERVQRYLGCLDLVDQLTAYVHKKLAQKPDLTLTAVLDNLASRIPQQGWDLGRPELVWIEKHLRARFASH
jgi:hypothetical protein